MADSSPETVHWLERLLDNTWLLLAIGILLPAISYTLWGIIELSNLQPAALP